MDSVPSVTVFYILRFFQICMQCLCDVHQLIVHFYNLILILLYCYIFNTASLAWDHVISCCWRSTSLMNDAVFSRSPRWYMFTPNPIIPRSPGHCPPRAISLLTVGVRSCSILSCWHITARQADSTQAVWWPSQAGVMNKPVPTPAFGSVGNSRKYFSHVKTPVCCGSWRSPLVLELRRCCRCH